MSRKKSFRLRYLAIIFIICFGAVFGFTNNDIKNVIQSVISTRAILNTTDVGTIPEYSENPYVVINDNIPSFSEDDITTESFEQYSELDILGRCGTAFANLSLDTMPTEERGNIGMIKPSGCYEILN